MIKNDEIEMTASDYIRALFEETKDGVLEIWYEDETDEGYTVAYPMVWSRADMEELVRQFELLCSQLDRIAKGQGIRTGSIFITRTGCPLDRSHILHEMKALCPLAQVEPEKVFPHNLRHLFACLYYNQTKDLCHLADVLGHSNINTTRLYTTLSTTQHLRQLEHLRLLL